MFAECLPGVGKKVSLPTATVMVATTIETKVPGRGPGGVELGSAGYIPI